MNTCQPYIQAKYKHRMSGYRIMRLYGHDIIFIYIIRLLYKLLWQNIVILYIFINTSI